MNEPESPFKNLMKKYGKNPNGKSPDKETIVVPILMIPFILSILEGIFGTTRAFYIAPSSQQIGGVGFLFFGGMILLTLFAKKIRRKHPIVANILTTVALTPIILILALIVNGLMNPIDVRAELNQHRVDINKYPVQ